MTFHTFYFPKLDVDLSFIFDSVQFESFVHNWLATRLYDSPYESNVYINQSIVTNQNNILLHQIMSYMTLVVLLLKIPRIKLSNMNQVLVKFTKILTYICIHFRIESAELETRKTSLLYNLQYLNMQFQWMLLSMSIMNCPANIWTCFSVLYSLIIIFFGLPWQRNWALFFHMWPEC